MSFANPFREPGGKTGLATAMALVLERVPILAQTAPATPAQPRQPAPPAARRPPPSGPGAGAGRSAPAARPAGAGSRIPVRRSFR